MEQRLAILVGFAFVVVLVSLIVRAVARRRVAAVEGHQLPEPLGRRLPVGEPGIVYFYGPHCAPCRQQSAILDEMTSDAGVAVIRVDATVEQDLADALAVATVPTTIVVDGAHTVRAINMGFRPMGSLLTQLRAIVPVGASAV
jgi:thiol-disulfide isomerase/thioredoxin